MKILNRIAAMVLALSLLLGASATVLAAEIEETLEYSGSTVSDLMNAHKVNPLTGNETEPFNAVSGSNMLMNKENELLLYTSNKKGAETKDDFVAIFEQMDHGRSYAEDGNISPELNLFFVTAVSLDASGNGTDDHIAYLGVRVFDGNNGDADAGRREDQVLMLMLYDARRNIVIDTLEIGSVKGWIDKVEHYSYKTLFSVTAGDYDGDGIDEIACTDANMGVQMVEIDTSRSALSMHKSERYDWTDLVSKSVSDKMKGFVSSTSYIHHRALISLTTGNFDGTGAEELAAAISTNRPDDDDLMPDIPEAYSTQMALLMRPLSDTPDIRTLSVYSTEASSDEEEQDNVIYRVLYLGQISAGDLDGDRRDEIAIAGYTGKIEVDGDGELLDEGYEYDEENIALCYAKLDVNRFGISAISVDAMTPFIKEGFFASNETLVPLSIDAAKLHGQYGKESVFVGGKVYQFSDGEASLLYTHAFFENESSWWYTDAYVEHVTSGVFGGPDSLNGDKPMINEQFVFTVVEKDNSQNEYSYKVGFISMSTNPETEMASFADNADTMEKDGYLLDELDGGVYTSGDAEDISYGTALVPVAADVDLDGILVKHTNTTYFYEDPSVAAILQAAPYFDELGSWNEFNSSTTYSVSVSRSLIDIWGYTHSIHLGFKGKVDFPQDMGEIELKVGYALDMDFEHEKAYTTTYTTTFEAGSYDTVVMQRTPYICYEYSYVDINGNLLTGEDAGSMVFMEALQPVYYQLSVDEYNRFVDEYNALADQHDSLGVTEEGESVETVGDSYRLVKITDDILPSSATGNPEKYYSVIHDGEYISQGTYALGHNGGYTTSEFSYEVEQTYTATYAHGMHFELEGVGKVGTALGVDFSIGAFAALSFQETCGYGEATVNGTGTGGTVANIIPSNYSEREQETLRLYGFNWRCAQWKKAMMTDAQGNPCRDSEGNVIQIPIVGYVVTNVQKPMAAPTGVSAYLSANGYQVTVNWAPNASGSDTLLGYYVYRSCDNQEPVQVNSTMISSHDSSYVDSSTLKPGKIYTYYVVARYENCGIEYSTMNPKSSEVVWGIPQMTEDLLDNSDGDRTDHTASMLGDGSFAMIAAMVAVVVSAAALSVTVASKKNKISADAAGEAEEAEEE